MANFFAEMKRRQIYRVAVTYVVVAWLLLQVVNNVAPILDLPPWIARAILLLLIIGFPLALIFAWIHQLAPARAAAAPVPAATGKPSGITESARGFLLRRFGRSTGLAPRRASLAPPVASPIQPIGVSIAVLPFVNMSGDAGQEFFSDGMTEEITAALAKVPDLMVIGRTSAFAFKGQNKDLRAIGQALGTTHLIEGSVRKAGDRVRITAQLIRAENGAHLWSENFDRQLSDIFAIQESIAQAIAASLRMPLGLKQGEHLVSNRAVDVHAYQQYLRAKALVRARGLKPLADAAALLEQVVARDPEFAPAWALLAQTYDLMPIYARPRSDSVEELRRIVDAHLPRAEAAAHRAIQLDPNHADGYLSLGFTEQLRGKLLHAEDLFKQALALDSNNPDVLHYYSLLLAEVGCLTQALAMRQQLQAQDPFVPMFNGCTGSLQWVCGQPEESYATFRALPSDFPFRGCCFARNYWAEGRFGEAADALLTTPPGVYLPGHVEEAARLLRSAPAVTSVPTLPRSQTLTWVYLHAGAPGRALAYYEDSVEAGYLLNSPMIDVWHPSYAPMRKLDRFKAFARKAGLVDYWRAKGWPEFCHPTTGDDFECN